MSPLPNVTVVGATGAVGQEMVRCLGEDRFAPASLRLFGSPRSAGTLVPFRGGEILVEDSGAADFASTDVALFATDPTTSLAMVDDVLSAGAIVIDNSSAFRLRPEVPLVIPEINGGDALEHQGIIANPNCSTIVTLMAVAPIHREFGVQRMVVSTYQAASGAGAEGVDELLGNSRAYLGEGGADTSVFEKDIAFNLIPWIGEPDEAGGSDEEWKMQREGRRILGHDTLDVSCTCVRIPVERAHSVSVTLFLESEASLPRVHEILESAPGIRVCDGVGAGSVPNPRDVSGEDDIAVGRVRTGFDDSRVLNLFVVGDQLRKGAALNAVQIAGLVAV